jgi:hypothetical protein
MASTLGHKYAGSPHEFPKHCQHAPISGLSVEIFGILFETAVQLQSRKGFERSTAVALSHVSRHWREIILTTPSLWARIFARSRTHPDEVAAHLGWSKKQPIDVRLVFF